MQLAALKGINMGLFRTDPKKAARKAYEAKMKEAMMAQRSGDIQRYAELHQAAEALRAQYDPDTGGAGRHA